MADAVRISRVRGYGACEVRATGNGWIGSKLGKKGDFVQVDASGYIDQAAAVSAAVSTTMDLAILNNSIAAAEAAAGTKALATKMRIMHDDDIVEIQIVTNSDVAITAAVTHIGDAMGVYRCTNGAYVADTNATAHLICVGINLTRNTGLFKLIEANRLK